MIKLLLVDNHTLLTYSLKIILEETGDIQVLGVAKNGEEALLKCKNHKPDLVLLDIKIPGLNWIEFIRTIKENISGIKVAILTSFSESKKVLNSFIAGVDAYLLKDTSPEHLVLLIKCIHSGFYVLGPDTKEVFQKEILKCKGIKIKNKIEELKVEEREIIKYICEGKNNKEIAAILGYADGTIKNKITNLLKIAGVETRAQLVFHALKNNVI